MFTRRLKGQFVLASEMFLTKISPPQIQSVLTQINFAKKLSDLLVKNSLITITLNIHQSELLVPYNFEMTPNSPQYHEVKGKVLVFTFSSIFTHTFYILVKTCRTSSFK